MLKGVMANSVNTWFQKGDVVEIKTVNEKSGLVLCYKKKKKKTQWMFAKDVWFAGEVGLSGEIRQITRIDQRISEAQKMGFKTILVPKSNMKGVAKNDKIRILEVGRVEEAFKFIFG